MSRDVRSVSGGLHAASGAFRAALGDLRVVPRNLREISELSEVPRAVYRGSDGFQEGLGV